MIIRIRLQKNHHFTSERINFLKAVMLNLKNVLLENVNGINRFLREKIIVALID